MYFYGNQHHAANAVDRAYIELNSEYSLNLSDPHST